jgi:hypothetical protein
MPVVVPHGLCSLWRSMQWFDVHARVCVCKMGCAQALVSSVRLFLRARASHHAGGARAGTPTTTIVQVLHTQPLYACPKENAILQKEVGFRNTRKEVCHATDVSHVPHIRSIEGETLGAGK